MDVVLILHSGWRWVVLLGALGALYGLLRARPGSAPSAFLSRVIRLYPVILDLQVALGIILWLAQRFGSGPLTPVQVIHPIWGLLAAGAAHAAAAFRDREEPIRTRGMLVAYALSLLLILIALASVGAFPFGRR